MNINSRITSVCVVGLGVLAFASTVSAQSSGGGSTYHGRTPHNATPRYVAPQDPTTTWQYRTVERTAPIVRGVRDCSFGALAGGARYGYGGVVGGCAAGVAGVSPGQVIVREFNRPVR